MDMSTAARKQAVAAGDAMPGNRFPVENRAQLADAIRAVGRVRPNTDEARAKVRRFIMRRASALNASDMIPDSWNQDGSLK